MNDSKLTFKKWPSVASPGATFEKTLKTSSSPQFVGWRQQQQIQVRTCSPTMAQYCATAGGGGAARTWCNIRPIWQYAAACGGNGSRGRTAG